MLGTDLPLAGLLPEDGLADGFDKVGRALNISAVQVERYMEAADVALTEAMTLRPKVPLTARRYNLWDDSGVCRRTFTKNGVWAENDDAVLAFYTNDKFFNIDTFKAPVRGKYRIRVSAYGTLMGDGAKRTDSPVRLAVHGGAFRTTNRVSHLVGFFSTKWEQPQVFEAVDLLEPGQTFKLTIAGQPPYTFYADEFVGPVLAVQWLEIEGPLEDGMAERQRALVYDDVDPQHGTPADARRLLARFAERAFRRPTTPADIAPYQAVMDAQLAAGATFQQALHVGLQTILCRRSFSSSNRGKVPPTTTRSRADCRTFFGAFRRMRSCYPPQPRVGYVATKNDDIRSNECWRTAALRSSLDIFSIIGSTLRRSISRRPTRSCIRNSTNRSATQWSARREPSLTTCSVATAACSTSSTPTMPCSTNVWHGTTASKTYKETRFAKYRCRQIAYEAEF
ncbi:MAG: DUF1595 domain-containing protein [Pirellulales bacterium]